MAKNDKEKISISVKLNLVQQPASLGRMEKSAEVWGISVTQAIFSLIVGKNIEHKTIASCEMISW